MINHFNKAHYTTCTLLLFKKMTLLLETLSITLKLITASVSRDSFEIEMLDRLFNNHSCGPTIFSGLIISSNFSPVNRPNSNAVSLNVLPDLCAVLAIFAAFS